MPIARVVAAAAVVAAVGGLIWVASSDDAAPAPENLATTVDYLPGRTANVYLPARSGRAPVVVLVPGGGWVSADPAGLAPLADALAAQGMVAVTITYRAGGDGARFPAPVQDIGCAVRFAADRAERAGVEPDPLVVLGHSSGAQLAALAALAGDRLHGSCRWPRHPVDGLVGLAGPYDVAAFADTAQPLFGSTPGEDPDRWRRGNPLTWVGERPGVAVLLAHGDEDLLVPPSAMHHFAVALRDAGHPVREAWLANTDHTSVYSADVAAPVVVNWLHHTWPDAVAARE